MWLLSTLLLKAAQAQEIIASCVGVGFPITEKNPAATFTVPAGYPLTYEWGLSHSNLRQNVVWLKCSQESFYFAVECKGIACKAVIVIVLF